MKHKYLKMNDLLLSTAHQLFLPHLYLTARLLGASDFQAIFDLCSIPGRFWTASVVGNTSCPISVGTRLVVVHIPEDNYIEKRKAGFRDKGPKQAC